MDLSLDRISRKDRSDEKVLLFAITIILVAACNRYECARPYPTDQKTASGSDTAIKYTYQPDVNVPPTTK